MAQYHAPLAYRAVHSHHFRVPFPFQSRIYHKTKPTVNCSPHIGDNQNLKIIKSGNSKILASSNFHGQGTVSRADQGKPRPSLATSSQSEAKAQGVGWIDSYLPEKARPYARLARVEKPIGTWLLAWPLMWSLAMAADPGRYPDIGTMTLFSIWSVALRGGACTINDFFDRDFDRQVERTKTRPMASGVVTPAKGLLFFACQAFLGLAPLLHTNGYSRILGALHIPFLVAYPLMKRITYWPQAFLGLMFNWGALLGWVVVKGSLNPAVVLPLYVAGFFWTLIYDTIYAHQDKEDDVRAGVKSTALLFRDSTKQWCTAFGIASICSFALSGFNGNIGPSYYGFLALASAHLAWQIGTVDLSSPADCNKKFVSNAWFGAIVFSGLLFGRVFR